MYEYSVVQRGEKAIDVARERGHTLAVRILEAAEQQVKCVQF